MTKQIFCHGEGDAFPEEQFSHLKDGSLLIPCVHDVPPPHYALTGGVAGAPADDSPNVAELVGFTAEHLR